MDETSQPPGNKIPTPGHSHHDTCGEICVHTSDEPPRPKMTGSSSSYGPRRRTANREGRMVSAVPCSPHGAPLMPGFSYPPRLIRSSSSHHQHSSATAYHHEGEHRYAGQTGYGQRYRPSSPAPASQEKQEGSGSGSVPPPGLYQSQWLPSPTLEPTQNTFLPLLEIEAPCRPRRLEPSKPEGDREPADDQSPGPRKGTAANEDETTIILGGAR